MGFSRDAIETSYGICRRESRRAGSNFHLGFLLLPREKRRAMEALYAFMRHTDDLADNLQPVDRRRDALATWRAAVERTLVHLPQNCCRVPDKPLAASQALPTGDNFREPVSASLPALADAVARFRIPHESLYAVIDGVEMDLDQHRYETFSDLETYCERVASAVGLACIHIWGFRGPEAFEPARRAGIALQLTNILRDLKEDAEADRVYLPLADLRRCDYSVDDLKASVADERFRRLMALEVARAEEFYAAGSELVDFLEPSGCRIFGLMMSTYRRLLRRIARRPADVFHGQVRLSGLEKLQLAARWSLLPPRKATLQ